MKLVSIALAAAIAAATPASAEEWLVVKDGSDAWAYEKSGTAKNETTGFLHIRLARYLAQPQADGDVSYQFDIRRYELDCAQARLRQISNERMTKTGKSVASAALVAGNPWVPASFGWPLRAKSFACDGSGLDGAVKSPNKAAAMVAMMGLGPKLTEAKPMPAPATTTPATAPAAASTPDKFCQTIRKVLGEGQKETPAFKSFYLNEAERQKYAGLGSTPIEGFGECRIQNMALPGKPGPLFRSYYCTRPAAAESDSAAFAASVSKKVATCLQSAYFVEGNDGGMTIKNYMYEMVLQGYPRVRVVHEKDHRVVIYLDTP
jgi:hypothetical protein